ncbi:MAG: LPS export ABC transporter periplasmic protein LptC, partial [Treponema sp.]
LLSSCSLNYDQGTNTESSVPEFTFTNATFNRYENDKLTMELNALKLEQYKDDGATYGQNVNFTTWNKNQELETEGKCGLLNANTKDDIYTLFNDIVIKSYEQNMEIYAQNLKFNAKTEQLTSGASDKIQIKRDDINIEGRGFSASGVSRSFAFTESVNGSIETKSESSQTEAQVQPENNSGEIQ